MRTSTLGASTGVDMDCLEIPLQFPPTCVSHCSFFMGRVDMVVRIGLPGPSHLPYKRCDCPKMMGRISFSKDSLRARRSYGGPPRLVGLFRGAPRARCCDLCRGCFRLESMAESWEGVGSCPKWDTKLHLDLAQLGFTPQLIMKCYSPSLFTRISFAAGAF